MKKIIYTLILSLICSMAYAQENGDALKVSFIDDPKRGVNEKVNRLFLVVENVSEDSVLFTSHFKARQSLKQDGMTPGYMLFTYVNNEGVLRPGVSIHEDLDFGNGKTLIKSGQIVIFPFDVRSHDFDPEKRKGMRDEFRLHLSYLYFDYGIKKRVRRYVDFPRINVSYKYPATIDQYSIALNQGKKSIMAVENKTELEINFTLPASYEYITIKCYSPEMDKLLTYFSNITLHGAKTYRLSTDSQGHNAALTFAGDFKAGDYTIKLDVKKPSEAVARLNEEMMPILEFNLLLE